MYFVVDQETSIENIAHVCQEYNFIPNTSIKRLLATTEQYALGTIGAIVTAAKKLGTQYTLEIKDGNSENDKEMVRLFPYKQLDYKKIIFLASIFYRKKKINMCLPESAATIISNIHNKICFH
jgi:hypothetical protein